MKKYIDAEKLKERLVKTVVTIDPTLEDTAQAWQKGYNIALMNVAGGLDEMQAADVVEVVRCKECKHRYDGDGICTGRGWPMQLVPDDGFCDKGERSEE